MATENNVSAEQLKALGKELKKQNKAANEELVKRSSKTLIVAKKVSQDIKESTTKGIKGIGDKAKSTITSIPDVAMANLDPSTAMLLGKVGDVTKSSFGYVKDLGKSIKEREKESAENQEESNKKLEQVIEDRNDTLSSVKESIDEGFGRLLAFMQGQSLEDYEKQREESARQKQLLAATKERSGVDGGSEDEDVEGSRFVLSPIFAKIKPILLMVAKGGAIALLIGGLFTLFRTIKDNPVFIESLQAIKEMWENDILPTFNRIKDVILDFIESPTFKAIQKIFNDIIKQMQNFLSRTLVNIAELFSGVFGGIGEIIEGFLTFDLKKINMGLGRIIESILGFAVSAIDNTITAILGMFGITFEGDATLFEAVGKFFSRLGESISNTIASIGEWVTEKIQNFDSAVERIGLSIGNAIKGFFSNIGEGISNFISSAVGWIKNQLGFDGEGMPSVSEIFMGIITAPFNLLRSAVNWLLSKFGLDEEMIPDPIDLIMEIAKSPLKLFETIRDFIVDKISGLGGLITKFIPGPIKSLFGMNGDSEGTENGNGGGALSVAKDVAGSAVSAAADFAGDVAEDLKSEVKAIGNFFGFGGDDDGAAAEETTAVAGGTRRGARNRGGAVESSASRTATSQEFDSLQAQRDQMEMERSRGNGAAGSNSVYAPTNVSTSSTQVIKRLPQVASRPPSAHDLIFGA